MRWSVIPAVNDERTVKSCLLDSLGRQKRLTRIANPSDLCREVLARRLFRAVEVQTQAQPHLPIP
jgi:hypothetical protein